MYMFDNRITIENREILEKYLNGYEYKASGLSFSAQYMWRESNRFSWDILGDYMCISGISHLELEVVQVVENPGVLDIVNPDRVVLYMAADPTAVADSPPYPEEAGKN